LREAHLFVNLKKTSLFCEEIDFLGHHILQRGIQADKSKIERILDWPRPKTASEVHGFLGLIRYIASFLPQLAEFTRILTPLTAKECNKSFPSWTDLHESAFEHIKELVVGADCLVSIDHDNLNGRRIFVTCDTSDWRTGAVLSFGTDWESARPVAFDSMQLNSAQQNYPVHEKELLAIVRALQKFRMDLLGIPFTVITDHRTLVNFNTQKDLSRRQARWQEFLSQYDFHIVYVKGEDNTVADALSHLPPDDLMTCPVVASILNMAEALATCAVSLESKPLSTLSIVTDTALLDQIRAGYAKDRVCNMLIANHSSMPTVSLRDGLWFIGDRLVILKVANLRKELFRMAHNVLGHFGVDKTYASLRDCYYWPKMRSELLGAYVPGCADCQRNKSTATKAPGTLHPLPIPDKRGDSVAINFIGLL
jgi:RNase H-like domain found in reverse transcriptase/Integrase zinc binding domain